MNIHQGRRREERANAALPCSTQRVLPNALQSPLKTLMPNNVHLIRRSCLDGIHATTKRLFGHFYEVLTNRFPQLGIPHFACVRLCPRVASSSLFRIENAAPPRTPSQIPTRWVAMVELGGQTVSQPCVSWLWWSWGGGGEGDCGSELAVGLMNRVQYSLVDNGDSCTGGFPALWEDSNVTSIGTCVSRRKKCV